MSVRFPREFAPDSRCTLALKVPCKQQATDITPTKNNDDTSTPQRVLFWEFLIIFWYVKPTKQHPLGGPSMVFLLVFEGYFEGLSDDEISSLFS